MPSPANASSPASRKFAWLAAMIVAVGALWTAGWYFFAAKVESGLPITLAQLVGPAASAQCTDADVRGYPFRFGVFCETLSYENISEGITANAGAFRSAAQAYRPQHAVAEIDGPLIINTPDLVFRADWQILQASAQAVTDGLDRGSIDAKSVSFDIDGSGLIQRLAVQADRMTTHARRNGVDLDMAAYIENLRNDLIPGLTAKAFTFEATLSGQSNLLEVPFVPLHGPFDAVLHRMAIEFDETSSVELTGPLQIDASNRVSGTLELTISNFQQLSEFVERYKPESASLIRQFGPMIAALDTKPNDDAVTLPLTIRSNLISLGFLPLGQLPNF
jgi:hypothetical protein